MRKIQGVILDIDGTLVESNEARAQSWVEAFREAGYSMTFPEVRGLVGLVAHDVLTRCVGFGEDTEAGRRIRDRARQIFVRRYAPRISPAFRSLELLARLERDGFRLAIASVDPPDVLLPLLRILGAEALVHRAACPPEGAIITNRDLIKGAMDRIGVPAPRAALLADSPHDIEAASKIGVVTIAIASSIFPIGGLRGALAAYPDIRTLHQDYDRSPFAAPLAA
jgi:phosphoglycolate phosphatase-like HAD superfamily hydrolase